MTRHPLDAVESALVDASNALQEAWPEHDLAVYVALDQSIDAALRLVQAEMRADLDPPDPRD